MNLWEVNKADRLRREFQKERLRRMLEIIYSIGDEMYDMLMEELEQNVVANKL